MHDTTTHLRLVLAAAGLIGAAVVAALLWGGLLPPSLAPVQRTVVLAAAVVVVAAPLLGAALPATRIGRATSAVLPALALAGFGTLFTDVLDVFPVRILLVGGALLCLGAVLLAVFAGAEHPEPADRHPQTAHRFH